MERPSDADLCASIATALRPSVDYGDSTDNRGKAAFWAAVDSERAGNKPLALALYKALLKRYGAGWYGVNAERHITLLETAGVKPKDATGDERLARAIRNLDGITIAPETVGATERPHISKAEQLSRIILTDEAIDELKEARQSAPNSPLVNLRLAQAFRAENENAAAINALKRHILIMGRHFRRRCREKSGRSSIRSAGGLRFSRKPNGII
jgi:tetratricopeptide (TPR) repeat protein